MPEIYKLITCDSELEIAARHWQGLTSIVLDTEFVRTDTFYPKLGLVQVSDGKTIWLLDMLQINSFEPVIDVLINPAITKIFHSCSEDLEVLRHFLGVIPSPLFDTQVAAAFSGYGFSKGYAALVEEILSVKLDKHETRSDWLMRPLSASQLAYAAEDVLYLSQLYHKLLAELVSKGRLDWFEEDMLVLVADAKKEAVPEDYYRRIKAAWKLDRKGLVRLQQLCAWRELEARNRDKPRNRIVADKDLLEVARHNPVNRSHLSAITQMHPRSLRLYGEKLLSILSDMPEPVTLPEAFPAPLPRESRKLQTACREWVEKKADELGVAPEVLARKKDIEPVVRSYAAGKIIMPDGLSSGWRSAVVGEPLKEVLTMQGNH